MQCATPQPGCLPESHWNARHIQAAHVVGTQLYNACNEIIRAKLQSAQSCLERYNYSSEPAAPQHTVCCAAAGSHAAASQLPMTSLQQAGYSLVCIRTRHRLHVHTIHTQRGNACAAEPCKNGIPQHTYTCGARCWRRLTLHQQTPWHELHHTSTRDERVAAAAVADTRVHHLQAPTPAIREHGGRQIAGSRYEQTHGCCHQLPAVACTHLLAWHS